MDSTKVASMVLLSCIIHMADSQTVQQRRLVPHIVHQAAPADLSLWKPIWKVCQDSWKKVFVEENNWEYRLWNDEELLDFVSNEFSWFAPHYLDYKTTIQRVDVVRYLILYRFGGIYADMDIYCHKFFVGLPNGASTTRISIIQSPYKADRGTQNALMVSPIDQPFWLEVVNEAIRRQWQDSWLRGLKKPDILYTTGYDS